MDFQSNLEFLCRVCAANTKGKNSVAECVYILKTPGLRDKLDKFLYLKVFENDALPKVLCKSCFRQVEATASLSKIAKHTQQVFRDFLFSSLPKGSASTDPNNSSEFTSSDFLSNKDSEKSPKIAEPTATSPVVAPSVAQLTSPPPLQTIATPNATPRKDEVIVNVSVSDPLTRENQQKVISISQRRHSIMIEAATAGSHCSVPANLTQKSQKSTAHSSGNSRKSSSPARVLQFCPIAPKPLQQAAPASQQATQVTTFSSGGYVIGPLKTPNTTVDAGDVSAEKEAVKTLASATAVTANDNTILQQKRKNLVKALNNIKANSTGQVSLLKSSQQKQQSLLQPHQPPPPSKSPLTELTTQVVEDELPDRIIIAAPKNKQSSGKSKKMLDTIVSNAAAPTTSVDLTDAPSQATTQAPPSKPNFPEDILLGRVIRDVDLLKLILKALKWPVNKRNMNLQLNRLKSSRFTDIMSDTNLLQDTDLTQLLGPYLAPVLMAAQALQQQQQQLLKNAAAVTASNPTPTPAPAALPVNKPLSNSVVISKPAMIDPTTDDINKSIPYKLPPETSVQLVPALPEETSNQATSTNSATLLKRILPKETKTSAAPSAKRQCKSTIQKHRDSIVISDEDEEETIGEKRRQALKQRAAKPMANFEIDLTNPNFLAQLGLINGSSELANEALLALLQKQKMAMAKQQIAQQRRRPNSSVSNFVALQSNEFDALINIDDDIVLMEPVTTTTTPAATGSVSVLKSQAQLAPAKDDNFLMPAQVQNATPIITRPIIKRRKTVIQSARVNSKDQPMSTASSSSAANAKETTKDEPATSVLSQVATQVPSNDTQKVNDLQSTSKSTSTEVLPKTSSPVDGAVSLPTSTETSPSKQGSRKQHNKAALGQQLLEAIGLQKISPKAPTISVHYVPSSSSSVSTSGPATTKQSVQQIRSALKKSLKQAQEQQQLRNKDISSTVSTTVIQDADSTTKPVIKDIVIEHRSNKTTNSSSSHVDVEDEIDKITLMKSQNGSTTTVTTAASATVSAPEKDDKDKKEQKTKTAARITERRRTLPSSVGRSRLSLNSKGEKSSNVAEEASDAKIDPVEKTKSEKDDTDSLNISSSSITSTELAQVKEEVAVTPRRRGRKRFTEAVENAETTASNSEKEKEKDKTNEKEKEKDKTNEKEKEKENEKDTKQMPEKSKTVEKIKEEQEETSSNSGRPTRQSKTLSKYYKGPDKTVASRRSLPSRSTRNRKYS